MFSRDEHFGSVYSLGTKFVVLFLNLIKMLQSVDDTVLAGQIGVFLVELRDDWNLLRSTFNLTMYGKNVPSPVL